MDETTNSVSNNVLDHAIVEHLSYSYMGVGTTCNALCIRVQTRDKRGLIRYAQEAPLPYKSNNFPAIDWFCFTLPQRPGLTLALTRRMLCSHSVLTRNLNAQPLPATMRLRLSPRATEEVSVSHPP